MTLAAHFIETCAAPNSGRIGGHFASIERRSQAPKSVVDVAAGSNRTMHGRRVWNRCSKGPQTKRPCTLIWQQNGTAQNERLHPEELARSKRSDGDAYKLFVCVAWMAGS